MTEFLENLISSRALLECLGNKITRTVADLQEQVNHCSCQYHKNPKLAQNAEHCATFVKELQHTMNYLEASFHKQQEEISQLKEENDRLLLQNAENQKKINILQTLSDTAENDIFSLVNKTTKSECILHKGEKELQDNSRGSQTCIHLREMFESAPDTTKKAFLAELTEQKKFYLEQLKLLYNEREITVKQKLVERKFLKAQVGKLTKKLRETQEKLSEVSSELSKFKHKQSAEESFWLTEKDSIQDSLEHCKEMLQNICSLLSSNATMQNNCNKDDSTIVNTLSQRLHQAENLLESYQGQMQLLEQTVAQYQELIKKKTSRFKSEMISGKLAHLKKKYRALYERRHLEMEGFQNDITMLRKRLDDLKTLLYRYISFDLQNQALHTGRKSNKKYQAYLSEQEIKTLKSEVWTKEKLVKSRVF